MLRLATGSFRPLRTEIRVYEPLSTATQVDPGRLGAARIAWTAKKTEFVKIEPESKPNSAGQPAELSEPIRQFARQVLGRGLALIIRHQSP